MPEQKVSLAAFIVLAELLDQAFPDPMPVPDYLSHDCERAEQALDASLGKASFTSDPVLAQLFAMSHLPAK